MMESNPYAPPRAVPAPLRDAARDLWRDGRLVVTAPDAQFPGRCFRCNAPATGDVHTVKLSWIHPLWLALPSGVLLIPLHPLFGLFPFVAVLVLLLARRRTEIGLRLCDRHWKRLRMAGALQRGGPLILGPLFLYAFASMLDAPVPWRMSYGEAMLVFGSALPWSVAVALMRRTVSARHISGTAVRLRGCGAAFLASLPPWPPGGDGR
jgi:hypothetical protein